MFNVSNVVGNAARAAAALGLVAAMVGSTSTTAFAQVEPVAGVRVEAVSVAAPGVERLTVELEPRVDSADSDLGAQVRTQPGAVIDPRGASMVVIHDNAGDLGLSVRSKNDGAWSEWVDVESAVDESPDSLAGEEGSDAPSIALGPIWIGDATDVEIVQTSGSNGALTVDLLTDEVESLPVVSGESFAEEFTVSIAVSFSVSALLAASLCDPCSSNPQKGLPGLPNSHT